MLTMKITRPLQLQALKPIMAINIKQLRAVLISLEVNVNSNDSMATSLTSFRYFYS